MFWLFGFRGGGRGSGEEVRVNPNSVRIVMHIGIYGRSLTRMLRYKFVNPKTGACKTESKRIT